ncbi:nucleotide-binding protein [Modestobacter sp. VKM Ac-2983]|uniref:nucleotide-binding protein n=1 Tax=Modestobacter sp. VKM Ac-2983 TaxID=3004137 RepID=UPI0022ABB4C4|nr:nucleotide-binding protein [Modestobacter sp. VKM Ac-2983]MCZ2807595.1 nucleotide-binding protein [Modestobacter sp. VKM Ac-2983]
MTYFHVRLSREGEKHDEVTNDITEGQLEDRFLEPYREGRSMVVNGTVIPPDHLTRIRISTSSEPSDVLIQQLRIADASGSTVFLDGPSMSWRAAARARDVTDEFITGPPGQMLTQLATSKEASKGARVNNAVFLIHGRDHQQVRVVKNLLRRLGLRIVEWEHAVARTGTPNPFIGDVVEAGLGMATAAVVLLTPDDEVRLRDELVHDGDGADEKELRYQARPNVYYEAGFADAIGRQRTVMIEIGSVKSFSDASGRHAVRYDGSPSKKKVIAERLKIAGLDVDDAGEDWLQDD